MDVDFCEYIHIRSIGHKQQKFLQYLVSFFAKKQNHSGTTSAYFVANGRFQSLRSNTIPIIVQL